MSLDPFLFRNTMLNLVKQWTLTTTQTSQMVRSFRSLSWKQNLHVVYQYGCESDVLLEHFHFLLQVNPLTPVPAITGRAKTHPQFPVPAVTSRKKAWEDNCLSYPPWRDFGSPIVLLLFRTNKPMRMDFLSIFLEDFRDPRKIVFVLKSRPQKVQVIMAHCGPNLQASRVLFSFLKRTNYFFGI